MTDLRIYTGRPEEDLLVGQWYLRMWADGDLADTFSANSRTLASLFRMIAPPKTLVFAADSSGIWFAMWGEQMLNGAFVGVWTRRDRRGSREQILAFVGACAQALEHVPVLLLATPHERLLDELRKLGWVDVDKIDEWMDGEAGWVMKLTRPEFAKSRKIAERIER